MAAVSAVVGYKLLKHDFRMNGDLKKKLVLLFRYDYSSVQKKKVLTLHVA